MEREVSSGVMIGVVLLILAAVVGVGFLVFSLAKGVASDGTVDVQDKLNSVSNQVFLDYDQKIITGTQVTSALKSFEGKGYAVLIATKALRGDQKIASSGDHPKAYVVEFNGNRFLNYNAVIAGDANGSSVATINGGDSISAVVGNPPTLQLKNGVYIAPHGFALTTSGAILYDNYTAGVFKSGNAEYIPSNTKFRANLLKGNSGEIMGVVFEQM